MPRGGGRSAAPRRAASAPSRNPRPQPAASAPHPAPVSSGSGSVGGGIGAAITDGLAWGTGTAAAHRAVDAIFGPRVIKHETVGTSEPAAAAAAAAPAPTMNSLANSDACGGQSKALSDLCICPSLCSSSNSPCV